MTPASLRALLEGAQLEGEYEVEHGLRGPPGCSSSFVQHGGKWPLAHCYGSAGSQEPKAALIAAAVNALPHLVALWEAAEAHLALHDHPDTALREDGKVASWERVRAALAKLGAML